MCRESFKNVLPQAGGIENIVFLVITPDHDEIHLYSFKDKTVRRLGILPSGVSATPGTVSRVAGLGRLSASRDGRWAVVSVTDQFESDIMVADGLR